MTISFGLSDAVILGIVASIPGILTAIQGFFTRKAIREVHLSLDGRLDALLDASMDKGRIAERDDQRKVDIQNSDRADIRAEKEKI